VCSRVACKPNPRFKFYIIEPGTSCARQPANEVVVSQTAAKADAGLFSPALALSHAQSCQDRCTQWATLWYSKLPYNRLHSLQVSPSHNASRGSEAYLALLRTCLVPLVLSQDVDGLQANSVTPS
jgi:hypothetical protein